MTGTELKERRQAMLLTQSELAHELRSTQNTVARWETGLVPVPKMLDVSLLMVESIVAQDSADRDESHYVDESGAVRKKTDRGARRSLASVP